jgi:hypothetical protein
MLPSSIPTKATSEMFKIAEVTGATVQLTLLENRVQSRWDGETWEKVPALMLAKQ